MEEAHDTLGRVQRLLRASLPFLSSESDLFRWIIEKSEDHVFACSAVCKSHGPTCANPKKTFLSTRNSRRSTHAFLFLLLLFGTATCIFDDMLKTVRKLLRPVCSNGIR
jgi:hypothetical protein